MSAPHEKTAKLHAAVSTAEDQLLAAARSLDTALTLLRDEGFGRGNMARELSIALTHAQTAHLWLGQVLVAKSLMDRTP